MAQQIAYLDCLTGLSGEMLLSALCDAGFQLDILQRELAVLPIEGYQLQLNSFEDKGIHGSCLAVKIAEPVDLSIDHLSDLASLLQASTLRSSVQEVVLAVFGHLIEATATVQKIMPDAVPIHELCTVETVITVIGIALGLDELGISHLYVSALPLTSGHVNTSQGEVPVPRPVTLEILRHVKASWKPYPVEEELVTPLGAALLATLASFTQPTIAIERIAYGFGRQHHCVRLYLGQSFDVTSTGIARADTDWIAVIETHIDNMNGEILGGLMERLFNAGALDVSYAPLYMKKNRPATLVTVLCALEERERFALILLRETSTLGVRIQRVQRLKAQREHERIETALGPMLIKVKLLGGQLISAAPEYEECQRLAQVHKLPLMDVYDVAQRAIQTGIIQRKRHADDTAILE